MDSGRCRSRRMASAHPVESKKAGMGQGFGPLRIPLRQLLEGFSYTRNKKQVGGLGKGDPGSDCTDFLGNVV